MVFRDSLDGMKRGGVLADSPAHRPNAIVHKSLRYVPSGRLTEQEQPLKKMMEPGIQSVSCQD